MVITTGGKKQILLSILLGIGIIVIFTNPLYHFYSFVDKGSTFLFSPYFFSSHNLFCFIYSLFWGIIFFFLGGLGGGLKTGIKTLGLPISLLALSINLIFWMIHLKIFPISLISIGNKKFEVTYTLELSHPYVLTSFFSYIVAAIGGSFVGVILKDNQKKMLLKGICIISLISFFAYSVGFLISRIFLYSHYLGKPIEFFTTYLVIVTLLPAFFFGLIVGFLYSILIEEIKKPWLSGAMMGFLIVICMNYKNFALPLGWLSIIIQFIVGILSGILGAILVSFFRKSYEKIGKNLI